ncbi:YolD-like family protein [Bacillus inaquosorum]|uniref:YolD-like family protein n=1 Tax=Bacillus inaquosorum TaxID=483913 RepID=UPI002281398D|nr:YolD-like family protein [Bacillus inaquosorum]MCY7981252.1 YolD-like family protein [Bacillus inaquosorum]MCY8282006.1 YolD-like family protein [Bacillus inaquosorum]MCY8754615.1 YolD-like family protein [Bacillus inaquosorum]MCY9344903.1 YolD-like family protein [Bacillus inaquosorum]MEC0679126.1 YolD-like family protein [Bacillus inaquosorum]
MLRDRGTIKWTSMMLPEHLTQLKQDLIDVSKIEKPSLDDQQIEEMDLLVFEALEFNKELKFKLFNNGLVENVTGRVHYFNFEQQKLHVKDQNDNTVYINMNNIIGVTYND